jgi:alpha,alpha-trehalase
MQGTSSRRPVHTLAGSTDRSSAAGAPHARTARACSETHLGAERPSASNVERRKPTVPVPAARITPEAYDAVLFDLDGVLTRTAKVHAACWKRMFDAFLEKRARESREPFRAFDIATEYTRYVDGKLRYDGVRSFLESRGITLPEGTPEDPPSAETVCGLGNRKNELIHEVLASEGVEVYDSSVAWVRQLRDAGVRTAVVSASRNCEAVLRTAGIGELFDVRVDGVVAARLGLAGKPAPDTFLEAARALGAAPARTVVVEDAVSGVQAGVAGGFGLVIGVDRTHHPGALRAAGAHIVVEDLAVLLA